MMSSYPRLIGFADQALTAEQVENLQCALEEIGEVLGPLDDLYTAARLILIHTGGRTIPEPGGSQAETLSGLSKGISRIYVGGEETGPRESSLAHELGHWLVHVWTEACELYWDGTLWERPPMRRLIRDADDFRETDDVYANQPAEIWARLFETFIAGELANRHPATTPMACHEFGALAYGFFTDGAPMHFPDYAFASEWELFAERMRRWVRRLLREIRDSPRLDRLVQ